MQIRFEERDTSLLNLLQYSYHTVNMHFSAVVFPLSLAGYCSAWAQAANGVWVANNRSYVIDGCNRSIPK
jgi:hypothetical protein